MTKSLALTCKSSEGQADKGMLQYAKQANSFLAVCLLCFCFP